MVNFEDGEIKDILPSNFILPETMALSYAVGQALRKLQQYSKAITLYGDISSVPEKILDLMAVESNTQYYDQKLPRQVKERLVMQSLLWYMHAGTPSVLQQFLSTVLDGGEIEEWFRYDGRPYYFKAYAYVGENEIVTGYGKEVKLQIERYKNVRSWLEFFKFIIDLGSRVPIAYTYRISFRLEIFPRSGAGWIRLNGRWRLNGKRKLQGYTEDINLYPCNLCIKSCAEEKTEAGNRIMICMEVNSVKRVRNIVCIKPSVKIKAQTAEKFGIKTEAETKPTAENAEILVKNKLNGTWVLVGKRKLNGGIHKT